MLIFYLYSTSLSKTKKRLIRTSSCYVFTWQKGQRSFQFSSVHFSSVQSLSRVRLFATPWIAAHQASLSITNSRSLLQLMSIELVMPFNHLILCRPFFLPTSIFPSIRVFSNESALHQRPKYWSLSFNISRILLTH